MEKTGRIENPPSASIKNAKEPIAADKSRSSTIINDKDSNEQAYRNESAAAAMNKGGQRGETADWEEQATIQDDLRGWPEHNKEKSETMT